MEDGSLEAPAKLDDPDLLYHQIKECISSKDAKGLTTYILERKYSDQTIFFDVASDIVQCLTQANLEENPGFFETCERCLKYLVQTGKPRLLLLAMLENWGYLVDDTQFKSILGPLRDCLLAFPKPCQISLKDSVLLYHQIKECLSSKDAKGLTTYILEHKYSNQIIFFNVTRDIAQCLTQANLKQDPELFIWNSVKLEKWLNAIRRQDQKNGEPWTPTENSYICSAHFTQDCFDLTGQTVRLRDHAVPSVFSNGKQKKTSAIHIKCLASSCQENACLPYPVIYLQDHLYHLPSNAAEKRLRNQKIPLSTAEQEFNSSSRFPELKPGQLRLYCHRLCPYSHRTKLVLEHKKIRYQPLNINLKSKPDWFLEKNPCGLVPVLERDDKIIYESLVCNDYLDDVCPVPQLQSTDPYLRARDRMMIGQFDKDIKMALNLNLNECQKAEMKQKLVKHLQTFGKELEQRGDYFGGDQVGLLDFNLWPWFERFEALEDFTEALKGFTNNFPTTLTSWKSRMLLQPAVQLTMSNLQPYTEFVKRFLTEDKNG